MKSKFRKGCDINCSVSLSAYKAFFYILLSSLSFSMNSVLIRFSRHTPALQMSMYRFMGMLFCNLPIAVHKGVNLIGPKGSRKLLAYRAVAGVFTVTCSFVSFRYLPIGEASVIVYSTPVFVTIFAKFILKEVCGVVQSFTVGLSVIGIILIINPMTAFGEKHLEAVNHTIGVLFGIAGLFGQCSVVILTRQTRNFHFTVVCTGSAALGTILCLLLTGTAYKGALPRCGEMRWVAVAMALSSFLGQNLYTKALQIENAGPLATLKAAGDIIFAVTWQVGIFHESLDAFAIGGTFLVVVSVLLVGLRKWVLMLPKDSTIKQKLRVLTD